MGNDLGAATAAISTTISRLAGDASIEIGTHDVGELAAAREVLEPGRRLYVSFLPKQGWEETRQACIAVRKAGFEPVPHIPVRRIESEAALEKILRSVVDEAGVREVLLIAGDTPVVSGPFAATIQAMRTKAFASARLTRISFGGHPEGHPTVVPAEIRRAEREKATLAKEMGLEATFVTQFFFEAPSFLAWVDQLRANGIDAHVRAGLAAPASLGTLFRFALRCGIGPSIRALGSRQVSAFALAAERGPDEILQRLAEALVNGSARFDGVHFYSFGGFLRACEWLRRETGV